MYISQCFQFHNKYSPKPLQHIQESVTDSIMLLIWLLYLQCIRRGILTALCCVAVEGLPLVSHNRQGEENVQRNRMSNETEYHNNNNNVM